MNNVTRYDIHYESRSYDIDGELDLLWCPEMKTRHAFSGVFQPLI